MKPDATPTAQAAESGAATALAAGLRGVAVSESKISFVDGASGRLLYRGYDIGDLAQHSTFEETSYLLLFAQLPKRADLKAFSKSLAAERKVPTGLLRVLKAMPADAHPMDALRTGVSFLGSLDPDARSADPEARLRVVRRLIARLPTIAAAFHQLRQGRRPVPPRASGSHARNFFRMLTGSEPDEFQERALDVALILHADHEFNASTFSARVTASTLSDLYSAVVSAIGALKGPLHGGANRAVMAQLKEIDDPSRAEAYVQDHLQRHDKIMGFGHAVYRTMDPRATVLKKLSEEAGRRYNQPKWYEISARVQETVYRQKQLWPNVDFYSASLYKALGIEEDLFPSLFAVSRVSGWAAHVLEQFENNKLIRPISQYAGPALRPYVAMGKR